MLIAIVSEQDIDPNHARGAILTAERKEFKGDTLENRGCVAPLLVL